MSRGLATTTGWVVFVAAIGMMFGMLAVDIASLKEWSQMTTPTFVGTTIGHIAAVIGAFVGGKLIPEDRGESPQTRVNDPAVQNKP
jgi:hypothetical protein